MFSEECLNQHIVCYNITNSRNFHFLKFSEECSKLKDTFSVVLSLQMHLLALADWLLHFLKPQLPRIISYTLLNSLSSPVTIFHILFIGTI